MNKYEKQLNKKTSKWTPQSTTKLIESNQKEQWKILRNNDANIIQI